MNRLHRLRLIPRMENLNGPRAVELRDAAVPARRQVGRL